MIQIGGLQKTTLIDYPQKLAATCFLIGCNFRCPWCYSKELVLPEEIEKQPRISKKDFFSFLEERKGFLEGIVLCGGEPTINKDLPEFCKEIKELGYLIKLDTNGSNPQMIKKLIGEKLIDYIAMDVKLPKEKYLEILGMDVKNIEESIKILKNSKIDSEFRTTVVPTVLEKKDILEIAKWISPAKKYYLQNYRAEKTIDSKFEKIKPYSQEYLLEIQKVISPLFEICQVR